MSIRMKLISLVTAFILVLGLIITGVLAASQQITLTGSVTFNVTDKSLWVKSLSIKKDNVNEEPVSDFLPGYINNNFNITIPPMTNNYGSFTLHFEIINTTTTAYSVTVDCSAYTSSGVTATASPSRIQASESEITNITSSTPTTTLDITITNPNGTTLDLSNIVITIEESPPSYQRVDADGTPNESGDYILFGYYPQTIKSADVTVDTSSTDSRGYYLGSDGAYYARVSANPYNSSYTFSNGSTIEDGQDYYFKVEKLMWRILDEDYNGTGNALIVCDTVVDEVAYQSNCDVLGYGDFYATDEAGTILTDPTATVGQGVDSNHRVYANNYEYSEIRAFLNETFYNAAFGDGEKEHIVQTTVDNSLESTVGEGGQLVCRDTQDYVFALSYSEASSLLEFEGFYTTDYALASCAYVDDYGNLNVWLRSPYASGGGEAYFYTRTIAGCSTIAVATEGCGVVPALQIKL